MTLSSLSLKNFKCFEALNLNLAPLTVLTGFNAGGKSSSIQLMLLLSQALRRGPNFSSLALNGPTIKLGEARDILNVNSDINSISSEFSGFGETISWDFTYQRNLERRGMLLSSLNWRGLERTNKSTRQIWPLNAVESKLLKSIRDITYIGANRRINSGNFPLPSEAILPRSDVGAIGQFAPYWYSELADDEVEEARRHPSDNSVTVRAQIDLWLQELFPGSSVNAIRHSDSSSAILQFRLGRSGSWSRPNNVGYGLSYIFPILVALLTVKTSRTVIIDSPEAHLHPRAQSIMGKILATFANAGVQIIVESHSDHLLSGIRLSVKEKKISPEHVRLYFFGGNVDNNGHSVLEPRIDSNGQIDNWPQGFFDQSDVDLAKLAGWV